MSISLSRWTAGAMLTIFMLSVLRAGAQPTTAPTGAPMAFPNFSPLPNYPVQYAPPDPAQIARVLDRIRQRIDDASPVRIVRSSSGQEITDLGKADPEAIMDRGPEKKFPPISYPMGVINSGMLLAAEVTGDKKFSEFVAKRYQFYADHYEALKTWGADPTTRRNPFWNFYKPDSLDASGSMGAAMVKARRAKVGPDLKPIIDLWANYVHKEQFRLADGTLARNRPFANSLWGDDMYMSVPLLSQYAKLTGDKEYFDDAVKQ